MDVEERIVQFEKLVADDATNDMACFSLAGAYKEVGRFAEAAESYLQCIKINPELSKAYQLAGVSLMASGDTDRAGEILTRGYIVAAGRGDLMPKNAMGDLLRQLEVPVPEVESKTEDTPSPDGSFICKLTGKPGTKMESPPFRDGVGTWIYENIAYETFQEWIAMGTKVINELRLDLSRDEHEAAYDYGMRLYLGLTDEVYRKVMDGKEPKDPGSEYKGVLDQIMGRMGNMEEFGGDLHKSVGG